MDRADRGRRGVARCGGPGERALLAALCAAWILVPGLSAQAEVAILPVSQDATLIEDAAGERANGAGPAFFVGRNNASVGSVRRALIAFDVAAALPANAWITGVEFEFELQPSNDDIFDLGLHRVLSAWSEGPASASGGGGAPAEPGDATWLHTRYDVEFWEEPGGDFAPDPSAVVAVADPGLYVTASTPELVADVQEWLDFPGSNHGWALVGGEQEAQTAKSFASRESPIEESRPRLVIEYETSCDAFGLGPGALGLCRAYCEALDCAGPDPRGSVAACDRLARNFARSADTPLPCARAGLD